MLGHQLSLERSAGRGHLCIEAFRYFCAVEPFQSSPGPREGLGPLIGPPESHSPIGCVEVAWPRTVAS